MWYNYHCDNEPNKDIITQHPFRRGSLSQTIASPGGCFSYTDMINCKVCDKPFKRTHWNQKLCSPECKQIAKRMAQEKYKQTPKGDASNKKWVTSEQFKKNEKRYRSKPERRKMLVANSRRYLENNPEARDKKRGLDRAYSRSERGRELNRQAQGRYRLTEKSRIGKL